MRRVKGLGGFKERLELRRQLRGGERGVGVRAIGRKGSSDASFYARGSSLKLKADESEREMVTILMQCYSADCGALQTRARTLRVSGAGVGIIKTGGSVGASGT